MSKEFKDQERTQLIDDILAITRYNGYDWNDLISEAETVEDTSEHLLPALFGFAPEALREAAEELRGNSGNSENKDENDEYYEDEIYVKVPENYVRMWWSDNPPADPDTATAVIGYEQYKIVDEAEGVYEEVDGGELDIQSDDDNLIHHVKDILVFAGLPEGEYEVIADPYVVEELKSAMLY